MYYRTGSQFPTKLRSSQVPVDHSRTGYCPCSDRVRILEKKEKIDKGKQNFSKELYTIDKKEGYKIITKDEKIK